MTFIIAPASTRCYSSRRSIMQARKDMVGDSTPYDLIHGRFRAARDGLLQFAQLFELLTRLRDGQVR
jgi:hypothetical protein